ncbi:uncharacterized protein ISCGN_027845 [Ixodes scapularis]
MQDASGVQTAAAPPSASDIDRFASQHDRERAGDEPIGDAGCSEDSAPSAPRELCCSCGHRPASHDAAVQVDPEEVQAPTKAPRPPARKDKAVGTDPRLGKKSVGTQGNTYAKVVTTQSAQTEELELLGTASEEPAHKERKFIVFESRLRQLFKVCKTCYRPCKVSTSTNTTLLTVHTLCPAGHSHRWDSMPSIKGRALGTLLLSGAILFTGSSPTKTLRLFELINLQGMCEKTYFNYQRTILRQAIEQVWTDEQGKLLDELRDQPLDLAGDGRCDSPGFCAKYLTYSLFVGHVNKILHFEQVQVGECETVRNSGQMEKEGLVRSLDFLKKKDITVRSLTTDRHRSIGKHMREQEPGILHYFDVWHVSKTLHYNENSSRGQAITQAGEMQWKMTSPKARKGHHSVNPRMTKATYDETHVPSAIASVPSTLGINPTGKIGPCFERDPVLGPQKVADSICPEEYKCSECLPYRRPGNRDASAAAAAAAMAVLAPQPEAEHVVIDPCSGSWASQERGTPPEDALYSTCNVG